MNIIDIIDTHAHYDDRRYDGDRDELIKSLPQNGVQTVINIGCTLNRSLKSVKLAEKYDHVYAAVGIHPDDVKDLPENYLAVLEKYAESKKVVAIGEIGLDYHYDDYDRETQIICFRQQLELAQKLKLPVVIHSRDATADTLDILREYKPKGVMHCFGGSAETAKEVLALGLYISFTGVVTFKNAKKAVEALKAVPMDWLLLETDCPYMAPEPFRGNRCDSTMIASTAQKVAEIKEIPYQQVIDICGENAKKLFGIN